MLEVDIYLAHKTHHHHHNDDCGTKQVLTNSYYFTFQASKMAPTKGNKETRQTSSGGQETEPLSFALIRNNKPSSCSLKSLPFIVIGLRQPSLARQVSVLFDFT